MSRARVLVREKIAAAGVAALAERCDVDVILDGDLAAILPDYDAIIVRSATKLTAEALAGGPRLRVVGRAGVGVDNVDVDAATRQGIVVVNTPDSTVVSAAEHAIGLMLALSRSIPQAHAALKEGRWERSRWSGIELAGKTLAVVGFGRIGQQTARKAVGIGMRVVGFDPFVSKDRFRELGVECAETLAAAVADADVVTLHAPLTPETRGLIGREAIAQMKDGVRIVNAARGELLDEEALIEALESGKVAGAGIDVFVKEPYAGPLLGYDNVVVTPHLAASTAEAQDRAGVVVAEQVLAALEGGVVTNAVNVPVLEQTDLEVLGPYVPLAAALGQLAAALAGSRLESVSVATYGPLSERDTRMLTAAALNGAFRGRVEHVNVVNAPVIASERGVRVSEERFHQSRDYMNLVEVRADGGGGEVAVAGTTIGPDHRLFLARAFGLGIDIEIAPHMVFLLYDDVPGVIGRVGTVFGDAGINIANMDVSREKQGAKALMAFSTDTPAPPALEASLHQVGFDEAHFISLD